MSVGLLALLDDVAAIAKAASSPFSTTWPCSPGAPA
jgi:hypothetical protein